MRRAVPGMKNLDDREVDMLGPFTPLVVGAHIIMAASSSGPPKINVEATCQASEKELIKLFGSGTSLTFDGCVRQQNEAREQLEKNWATYPAAARAHCVQPKAYLPSYVEWLSCFETDRYLREIRQRDAEAAKSNAAPPRRQPQ
jgi:hypothetical protein